MPRKTDAGREFQNGGEEAAAVPANTLTAELNAEFMRQQLDECIRVFRGALVFCLKLQRNSYQSNRNIRGKEKLPFGKRTEDPRKK